jgi:hypothetical protein
LPADGNRNEQRGLGAVGTLLQAPAIVASSLANGAFRRGSVTIQGQVKPTGTPTYVGNAQFPGMLFYGFDTGLGVYTTVLDCPTGPVHNWDPPNSIGAMPSYAGSGSTPYDPKQSSLVFGSTAFGNTMVWQGASLILPGVGSFVGNVGAFDYPDTGPGGSPLRDAVNLQAAGTGASFIMGATFMLTANTPGGSSPLIFGRASLPDDQRTYAP